MPAEKTLALLAVALVVLGCGNSFEGKSADEWSELILSEDRHTRKAANSRLVLGGEAALPVLFELLKRGYEEGSRTGDWFPPSKTVDAAESATFLIKKIAISTPSNRDAVRSYMPTLKRCRTLALQHREGAGARERIDYILEELDERQ